MKCQILFSRKNKKYINYLLFPTLVISVGAIRVSTEKCIIIRTDIADRPFVRRQLALFFLKQHFILF